MGIKIYHNPDGEQIFRDWVDFMVNYEYSPDELNADSIAYSAAIIFETDEIAGCARAVLLVKGHRFPVYGRFTSRAAFDEMNDEERRELLYHEIIPNDWGGLSSLRLARLARLATLA